jgi:hypothetical protein
MQDGGELGAQSLDRVETAPKWSARRNSMGL